MNTRVRELRSALEMTADKFAQELGVGRSAISNIEAGTRSLTDQMINSICKTNWGGKYVNEDWLRTGEGDMFLKFDLEDEIANMIAQLSSEPDDSFKKKLLSVMAGLTEAQWETLAEIAKKFANEES